MKTNIDYRDPQYRTLGFDKFYEFHISTNDCSPDIAVETWIANKENWDYEKRCVMALFHGATYAGPCETMFADKFPVFNSEIISSAIEFFEINKKRLLFSPDCKYRKMVFPKFLQSIGDSLMFCTLGEKIKSLMYSDDPKKNYLALQKWCMENWYHWGRMGHWCFSEALHRFINAPIEAPTMEFGPGGKSHTAGWAFSIGLDDYVDKAETLEPTAVEYLEGTARKYITEFQQHHPQLKLAQYFTLETACCNYKRQHKGSRYGGCYIDEQYDEILYMQSLWPEYKWLWDLYIQGRQAVIPLSLLFENFSNIGNAYMTSWCNALKDWGRIPRIEAWHNKQPQEWRHITFMPWYGDGGLENL
jgi:hypothetical protein